LSSSIIAIILNRNGFQLTVSCVDSLKKSTVPLKKILVIDQASDDGSGKRLLEFYENDDQVHVDCNTKNHGFALGMNIGIRKAMEMEAEMVFIVNNDTIIHEECLQHLRNVVAEHPLAAAVGPAIMYYSNPNKIWQAGGYFNKFKMGITVPYKGKMYSDISKDVSSVEFLTGCALLIPVRTFERVGFFDSDYFFYAEDADYGLRIKEANMNMYFAPTAKMWHKIEDIAVDRTTPFVLYNLAKSTIIMLRKRFSRSERYYGIFLQFTIYTLFRIWQVLKGRRGIDSIIAWIKGLIDGIFMEFEHRGNDLFANNDIRDAQ
jgi:GT2 family glycosyltransferase